MACKHWIVLQSEEANRVPLEHRPYCFRHRQVMAWRGGWVCETCAAIPAVED